MAVFESANTFLSKKNKVSFYQYGSLLKYGWYYGSVKFFGKGPRRRSISEAEGRCWISVRKKAKEVSSSWISTS